VKPLASGKGKPLDFYLNPLRKQIKCKLTKNEIKEEIWISDYFPLGRIFRFFPSIQFLCGFDSCQADFIAPDGTDASLSRTKLLASSVLEIATKLGVFS
jgi:hypothetical protein